MHYASNTIQCKFLGFLFALGGTKLQSFWTLLISSWPKQPGEKTMLGRVHQVYLAENYSPIW